MSELPKKSRELDARSNDGLEVRLLWTEQTGLKVSVYDAKTGDDFEFPVVSKTEENLGHIALDAFHHPYAYAASRGIHYNVVDQIDRIDQAA